MKTIFTLSLLITFFISCTKNKTENTQLTFTGKVFDFTTHQTLPNVNVRITLFTPWLDSIPAGYEPITGSAFTNANGEFSITINNNPWKTNASVEIKKEGYSRAIDFCNTSGFGGDEGYSINKNQTVYNNTFLMDKNSIVNFHFNNVAPSNINDTLIFETQRQIRCTPTTGKVINDVKVIIGLNTNHIISDTFSFKEASLMQYSWYLRNNGVVSNGGQIITPIEFGAANYTINY